MQSEQSRSIAVIKRDRGRGHTERPSDCKLTAITPLPRHVCRATRAGRRLGRGHHLQGSPLSSTITCTGLGSLLAPTASPEVATSHFNRARIISSQDSAVRCCPDESRAAADREGGASSRYKPAVERREQVEGRRDCETGPTGGQAEPGCDRQRSAQATLLLPEGQPCSRSCTRDCTSRYSICR
jgi:hypothetical protein